VLGGGSGQVDARLQAKYLTLSSGNPDKWEIASPGGRSQMQGIELASMRQVAWELLETLKERRKK